MRLHCKIENNMGKLLEKFLGHWNKLSKEEKQMEYEELHPAFYRFSVLVIVGN